MESNENLKPLSLNNEDALKPLSFDFQNTVNEDFVPIAKTISNDIKNKESNFVFFFGTAMIYPSIDFLLSVFKKSICQTEAQYTIFHLQNP